MDVIAAELRRRRAWAIGLPRSLKRLILAVSDFLILSFAVWLAISLRYNEMFVPPHASGWLLMFAAPAIGVGSFAWFGLYRLVTRFITIRGSARLLQCIGISVLFWALLAFMFGALWIPRSVATGWVPYRLGHWVWVHPWGWTWVDHAPWGFAPFHYGRWVFVRARWCWVPGPRRIRAVYAPALVVFVGGGSPRLRRSSRGPTAIGPARGVESGRRARRCARRRSRRRPWRRPSDGAPGRCR